MKKQFLMGIGMLKTKFKKKFPLYVGLQVTNKCNLKCKYCYAYLDSLKNSKELTTEEIINLIGALSKKGTRFIRLLGGEPLLREDIGIIIDYCNKKNIVTDMAINGYFLKDKINELKNLDFLCISIDGDKEVTDFCRGKGSYDKAIEALKIAKENNIKTRLHATLTKYNVNNWDNLIKLSNKYNVSFNFSDIVTNNKEILKMKVPKEELIEFFKNLKRFKKEGIKISNSNIFIDHVINFPDNSIKCLAGKYHCMIDSDGMVYACASLWKNGINLKEGFDKAFDYLKIPSCGKCHANGDLELYATISLKPKAVWNAIKNL